MNNNDLNVIDIEMYGKEEKKVPKENVLYRFKVGNKICEHDKPTITGREILNKAELSPPEQYQLNRKFKKGKVDIIELDQVVDLTEHGLERFTYMKLDQTEGSV